MAFITSLTCHISIAVPAIVGKDGFVLTATQLTASCYYIIQYPKMYFPMKNLIFYIFIIVFLWTHQLAAQTYGNEWIDHSLTYYKLQTTRNGLHRIPTATLQNAGIDLLGSQFALYYRGEEVPIYVTTPGIFSVSDYIEFVAEPNNAAVDTLLFATPSDQLNPKKSLFSDTATYFLAAAPNAEHLRFVSVANDLSNVPPPEAHFIHTSSLSLASVFSEGVPFVADNRNYHLASFGANEGFLSTAIVAGSSQNFQLITPAPNQAGSNMATLTVKVVGRNNPNEGSADHDFRLKIGGTEVGNGILDGFAAQQYSFSVPLSLINSAGITTVTLENASTLSINSQIALAYITLSYNRLYDLDNVRSFSFTISNAAAPYLELLNFNGGTSPVLYDLTNLQRILPVNNGIIWQVHLPPSLIDVASRRLHLTNTTSTQAVTTIATLTPVQFTDYTAPAAQAEFVIITHRDLWTAANEYATYRRSDDGKGLTVQVVDIEQLYDQFAYGINKNPLAIRHYINQAIDNWAIPPQYVLLLGKGTTYSEFSVFNNFQKCLVPTYGTPPSDLLLTCRNATATQAQVAVGRIPATNNAEIIAYLDKVRQYEAQQNSCADSLIWRKNMISIVQNDETPAVQSIDIMSTQNERNTFAGVGAGMTTASVFELNGVNQAIPNLQNLLNTGLGIILYSGESINNTWNANFSLDNYQFSGKYPFVFSQTDFLGNVHASTPTLANEMVLSNQNGSIGFADNTSQRIPLASHLYLEQILTQLNGNAYTSGIGVAIKQASAAYLSAFPDTPQHLFAAQTYQLTADPALAPVPSLSTELSINKESIIYYNPITNYPILSTPPYIDVLYPYIPTKIPVWNMGRATTDSATVAVRRFTPTGEIITVMSQRFAIPFYKDTISLQIPNTLTGADGANSVTFFIDADQEILEKCDNNNVVTQVMEFHLYNSLDSVIPINASVYPNPSSDMLYIEIPNFSQPYDVSLIDSNGQTQRSLHSQHALCAMSIENLPQGIYFLQLQTTEGIYTTKIIKQ